MMPSVGGNTNFVYDGLNIVQEPNSFVPSANYLTGANIDETFSRTASGSTQSYLTDILGSTLAVTNSAGAIQTSYAYDPYGNTASTGGLSYNAPQYTGRENDGDGLYYYRARYYSPVYGRFISEDPYGSAGSGPNLYSYADEQPTIYVDPTGQFVWIPVIIVGGGAAVGGFLEGYEAYEHCARGFALGEAIGRGVLAGGLAATAGLAAGVVTDSPFIGGAASGATYYSVNSLLEGDFTLSGFFQAAVVGGTFGWAAKGFAPAVRGGWNFNAFTSPRTFGPKAIQLYAQEAIAHAMNTTAALGTTSPVSACGCH